MITSIFLISIAGIQLASFIIVTMK